MRRRFAWLGVLALLFLMLSNANLGGEIASAASNRICFVAASPRLARVAFTGTAFVQLLPGSGPQAGRQDLVYGFEGWNDTPAGAGEVTWAKDHYWDWKICYPVTPAKYNAIADFIRNQIKTPDSYRLLSNNCLEWIQQIARIANVDLPASRSTAYTNLPISDPETFAKSLQVVGIGGTFGGGTVLNGAPYVVSQNSTEPQPAVPDQCSYAGTEAAAFRDPQGLATELNRQVHDRQLGQQVVGVGQALTVNLQNVTLADSLAAVDFGDGSILEQQTTPKHVYQLPGEFPVTIIVVSPTSVDRFTFVVRASAAVGSATTSIPIPTDPPPVPFPAVDPAFCPESLDGLKVCDDTSTENLNEYFTNHYYYDSSGGDPRAALPDERYFSLTGFRIDDDLIWDYFSERGGLAVFGYPISRDFTFRGLTVQFFQRRVVEIDRQGQPRLLNVLDPDLLGYSRFNGATFPNADLSVMSSAPNVDDTSGTLDFVSAHAPDFFDGMPVNFSKSFQNAVTTPLPLPIGGYVSRSPGFDLEMWGLPTSKPLIDPNNHSIVYLRFQRGIMQYDANCHCTQSILLGDYLKSVITGQGLPDDLRQEAQASPYYDQYDPTQLKWLRDPDLLPNTDLTNAFVTQVVTVPGQAGSVGEDVSPGAVILDTTVLVFRQCLEAILVLAAVTTSLVGKRRTFWKPIGIGAVVGLLATAVTWFLVVAIISAIGAPSIHIQAVTEVLAVILLLVVMNWFFHRIYWTGWISRNTRKQRELIDAASRSGSRTLFGLGLLGFVSIYREGFEVVLFLQNLRIKAGSEAVFNGVVIGLIMSLVVAWLTFVAHEHLPYKKMLVLTGVMLGFVLLVLVGGGVHDLQEAYWLGITPLPLPMPTWLGVWFSVYPTVEGLAAQVVAGGVVIGSYLAASRVPFGRLRPSLPVYLGPKTLPGQ